jgi:hypothetical protein
MKSNVFSLIIATVICFGSCARAQNINIEKEKQTENLKVANVQKDKEEIQKLVRQVLNWSESKESIDLLPVLTNSQDSIYIGFDMDKLKENLNKLKGTGFFSSEFIENYKQVILTLDGKLRNKEYIEWLVGDLPPFKFANDINPWCLCQGFSPEQCDDVEIIKIDSKSGELIWNWKKGTDWMNFKFKVVKEDNKWKISYMQGFDYKESTKKDGEI